MAPEVSVFRSDIPIGCTQFCGVDPLGTAIRPCSWLVGFRCFDLWNALGSISFPWWRRGRNFRCHSRRWASIPYHYASWCSFNIAKGTLLLGATSCGQGTDTLVFSCWPVTPTGDLDPRKRMLKKSNDNHSSRMLTGMMYWISVYHLLISQRSWVLFSFIAWYAVIKHCLRTAAPIRATLTKNLRANNQRWPPFTDNSRPVINPSSMGSPTSLHGQIYDE